MHKLIYFSVCLGCDPEFFFSKENNIIGAEKILPKNGFDCVTGSNNYKNGKVIIDGVQAELNPQPSTCRESLAIYMSNCFDSLYNNFIKKSNEIKVDFSQVIEIDKNELMSLGESSRVFGCEASQNFYSGKESMIKVKANEYKYRSAGGHIHLGYVNKEGHNIYNSSSQMYLEYALKTPAKLVPMLDIILGNTCVLVDKNVFNKERRKVYGKAGEYRLPKYGLEYRTLSNFWLTAYPLMSFVMGLARFAVLIIVNDFYNKNDNYEKAFRNSVKTSNIEKAINENDFNLALKNFYAIKDIIMDIVPVENGFPLNFNNMKEFEYFIKKDMNYWFKKNPLMHWKKLKDSSLVGWEKFSVEVVRKDMQENENK